jgi:hypothetical protein
MSDTNTTPTTANKDGQTDLRAVYVAPTVSLLFVTKTESEGGIHNDGTTAPSSTG